MQNSDSIKGDLIGQAMIADSDSKFAIMSVLSLIEGEVHLKLSNVGAPWEVEPGVFHNQIEQLRKYINVLDVTKSVYELQVRIQSITGGKEDWDFLMAKVIRDMWSGDKETIE